MGVNTGIADVHNLVWKICAVQEGWAANELLETFELERRPVAVANARQSALNQLKLLLRAFAPSASDEDLIRKPELNAKLQEAIKDNSDHFDSINLQIGYVYGSESNQPCDVYIPKCVPGSRLPHAWITQGERTLSTLDLINGKAFVLLVTSEFLHKLQSKEWRPTSVSAPLTIYEAGKYFNVESDEWMRITNLRDGISAVLVRPDGHVVCCAKTPEEVESALLKLLQG